MRFNPDRCAHCGGPPRTFKSEYGLSLEGKMASWETFFFCSDDCLTKEINHYMPDDVAIGKTIGDDKEYKTLTKAYDDRRKRLYPTGQLYSNEELAERDQFDIYEQRVITQYEDNWLAKRTAAITKAVRDISDTWASHHSQALDEVRREAEVQNRLYRSFDDFDIPLETRFSGHWIIAPPGRGKTTLLHAMFLEDAKRNASIIVLDSKGDLIGPLKDLAAIKDRLVLIEPDPDFPLALNPLDIPKANVAHTISLLEYIFSALLEAKMTALQMTLFRSVLPALIEVVPNATLDTFRDVIENGIGRYKQHFEKLSPDKQEFFNRHFDSKTYSETRQQLVWRLQFLMTNPVIKQMFSAPKTKLDIGKEMDAGKIILIDNSKQRLGDEGSEFFGRFFVALVLAAAQQRAGRPEAEKLPCYFYIDECQNVIRRDEKISTILDECRSQKIAMIMAHQRTAQITNENVLDALANCAIRMANSDDEAKYLAPKLRCDAEFLHTLPRGTFATYVRDLTPKAVALKIPHTDLSRLPKITASEQADIRNKMRAMFSFDTASSQTSRSQQSERTNVQEAPVNTATESSSPAPLQDQKPEASDEAGSTW